MGCFSIVGFPGGSALKNPLGMQETCAGSLGWEDPLEKGMATRSSILAWEIPRDRGAWQLPFVGSEEPGSYRSWGRRESDTTEQLTHFFNSSEVLSHVRLFATPWSIVHQSPLSIGFSRQEYCSGLPFPSPEIFPTQGSNPGLPHCGQML